MTNNNYFVNPGMMYGQQAAQISKPRMSNPLSKEEQEALKNQVADQFSLSLTTLDMAKAMCTHKDPNTGLYTIVENADGTITCTQCHETFDPDACTPEAVEEASKVMKNVLQTLKYIGIDLSNDVIRGFFGFMPYIEKIPQLYKIALNSYNRYNPEMLNGKVQQVNNGANIFGAFNNIMNPAAPVYNGYMMQQQMVAPQGGYYYNPQQAAMMGQPQQMPGNPFYAQAPAQPMAPQAAPQVQPQAPVAPQAAPVAQPDQVVVKEQLQL